MTSTLDVQQRKEPSALSIDGPLPTTCAPLLSHIVQLDCDQTRVQIYNGRETRCSQGSTRYIMDPTLDEADVCLLFIYNVIVLAAVLTAVIARTPRKSPETYHMGVLYGKRLQADMWRGSCR